MKFTAIFRTMRTHFIPLNVFDIKQDKKQSIRFYFGGGPNSDLDPDNDANPGILKGFFIY